jgi:hypothetical protein
MTLSTNAAEPEGGEHHLLIGVIGADMAADKGVLLLQFGKRAPCLCHYSLHVYIYVYGLRTQSSIKRL